MDALFNQRKSDQRLAPSAVRTDVTNINTPQEALPISADNVYNPFGEAVDLVRRRLVEAGPRSYKQSIDGLFSLLGRDFDWGVNAVGNRSDGANSPDRMPTIENLH